MIWAIINFKYHRKDAPMGKSHVFWPNRRNTYRIIYPAFLRPRLIVERSMELKGGI
jgi:hypothetical protein